MTFARPTLRIRELWLLILVGIITATGLAVVSLANAESSAIPIASIRPALAFAGLTAGVSLIWSVVGFRGDRLLFPLAMLLGGIGLVMMTRLTPDLGVLQGLDDLDRRQMLFLAAGMAIVAITAPLSGIWPFLQRYKYTILLFGIALLVATFVFGEPIYGARIWIRVGPVLLQPGEIVKILLVLFLAAYLDEKRDLVLAGWNLGPLTLPALPYLIPIGLMAGASVLVLVIENDLGSALMLFAGFLVVLYAATGRASYLVAGLAGFAAAAWLAYQLFDRIAARAQNWLNPWSDPFVVGWQQIQSDYALASAGVIGSGLGAGQPWRIPVVQSDYIFAAIGEELGFAGSLAIIALVALVVLRGARIAMHAPAGYHQLVAIGLTATIGVQAIIIVGGVSRMLPLTGITLPFLSYGGSSLLTNCLLIGLLLNISGISGKQRGAGG